MKKYRFGSRAEAEAAYAIQDSDASIRLIVLGDILMRDGADATVRRGGFTFRLFRATSASGGILVVTQAETTHIGVHYFETYAQEIRRIAEGSPTGSEYWVCVSACEELWRVRNGLIEAA